MDKKNECIRRVRMARSKFSVQREATRCESESPRSQFIITPRVQVAPACLP
jgi:hypothetical protein